MRRILILEDDHMLARGICLALRGPDTEVTLCGTLAEASKLFDSAAFRLLILDINLPDGSGADFLRKVRQTSAVPVILLTANDMEMNIVNGLEAGADDYITKPFSLAVLRARVNAQLRRAAPAKGSAVKIDNFLFDFDKMEFLYGDNVFEKDGINRDRPGEGEKTRYFQGKTRSFSGKDRNGSGV